MWAPLHHTSIDVIVTTHGGQSSFPLFICLILKAFSLNSFNLIFKFNQAFSFPLFICLILKSFRSRIDLPSKKNLIFKFNQAFSFPPFSLPVS
ncbi:hypothetical protein L2E82_29213 [Cichorium intybus]|uniref:Uncharacterized protein n=1 Tax=Cichorium intybus TaxID=13427 RepID=A0ACB9CXL9_CICIN|nr:hypothetical protein L2E82_29213 [Cichorium intybus]